MAVTVFLTLLVAPFAAPGWIADYGDGVVVVDSKPAHFWGATPIRARWTGLLALPEDVTGLRFGALASGRARLVVGGREVLLGEGASGTSWIEGASIEALDAGDHAVELQFESAPNVPARLQLWWVSDSFRWEPFPAWAASHDSAREPPELARTRSIEEGHSMAIQLGCLRCHVSGLRAEDLPRPGPSLESLGSRTSRGWLLRWLDDPRSIDPRARMPRLFPPTREGFVERWLVAESLLQRRRFPPEAPSPRHPWRQGKKTLVETGCIACHLLPDAEGPANSTSRSSLRRATLQFSPDEIAEFLSEPEKRFPDHRMPRFSTSKDTRLEIASYLEEYGLKHGDQSQEPQAPSDAELGPDPLARAATVIARLRCGACHEGLATAPELLPRPQAMEGCLTGRSGPSFALSDDDRAKLRAFLDAERAGWTPSNVLTKRSRLSHLGCFRCHRRSDDEPSPLEDAVREVPHEMFPARLPYLRVPSLAGAGNRFKPEYIADALENGIAGVRPGWYTFRMPAYGSASPLAADALLEIDGENADLPAFAGPQVGERKETAPTDVLDLAADGMRLAGHGAYACIACHSWKATSDFQAEPGSAGPDLTRIASRVRRDWFDRWLESPQRFFPRTPMPSFFPHGRARASLDALGGDPERQKEALWQYLSRGEALGPPPLRAPAALDLPADGNRPRASQIPLKLPDGSALEALVAQFATGDVLVYDVERLSLHSWWLDARILRSDSRWRTWILEGTRVETSFESKGNLLDSPGQFVRFEVLADGVRIETRHGLPGAETQVIDTLHLDTHRAAPELVRRIEWKPGGKNPQPGSTESRHRRPAIAKTQGPAAVDANAPHMDVDSSASEPERGYKVVELRPEPTSPLIMPCALSVRPRDGALFVASMKLGGVHRVDFDGKSTRFVEYAGPFQEPYGMAHRGDDLFVLHRRNLTRIRDVDGDGRADTFDRIATWPQGLISSYDWGYGLVSEPDGSFVFGLAPWANRKQRGSGGALRLRPDGQMEDVAFGFRNPFGWCAGPEGGVFVTDNQGEWVAANRLCHATGGRHFGFPNPEQLHDDRPRGKTALWVPYGWAKSINGLAYDSTEGKFGPFAGQIFLAELYTGGGILRAQLERVNGEWQGACFPFWGKGLLGPLVMMFDIEGRLVVGSLTEPAWMGQPDRGALYRIEFTGPAPFEIERVQVRPRGFRLIFTLPCDSKTSGAPSSYQLLHYRYSQGPEYGSPEMDKTPVMIHAARQLDARTVELETDALVPDRVYRIRASGVRSAASGDPLVHDEAAYTMATVPR